MTIITTEKVGLTADEKQLLRNARSILNNIYNEATDSEICNLAGTISVAITELLGNHCN